MPASTVICSAVGGELARDRGRVVLARQRAPAARRADHRHSEADRPRALRAHVLRRRRRGARRRRRTARRRARHRRCRCCRRLGRGRRRRRRRRRAPARRTAGSRFLISTCIHN